MPLTYVLGVQLGLGRLHGDRELLALASAGRSPWQLFRVPVVLAVLLGLCSAWLVQTAEPWGLAALRASLDDVIRRNLRSGLLTGVFNDGLPRLTIYVEERQAGPDGAPGWRHLLVEDRSGKEPLLALADQGRLSDDGADAFTLQLTAGELFRPEEHGELRARFETASLDVDLKTLLLVKNKLGTSEAALPADELEAQAQAREAAHDVRLAGRARLEQVRRKLAALSCLSFLLLAVPLALVSGGARGAAYLTTLLSFAVFFRATAGRPCAGRGGRAAAPRGALAGGGAAPGRGGAHGAADEARGREREVDMAARNRASIARAGRKAGCHRARCPPPTPW